MPSKLRNVLKKLTFLSLLAAIFSSYLLEYTWAAPLYGESVRMQIGGTRGMIAADDALAAAWGTDILREGGNAVDGAIATAFAMSVTRPHFASIGGGGFMVYCPAQVAGKTSPCVTLDFREKAPSSAQKEMYIRNGKADPSFSRNGALASGVPGNVMGWLEALKRFGHFTQKEILRKPISLARDGIRVSSHTEEAAIERWDFMNDEAKRIFSCGHKDHACKVGETLKQPDLAKTLTAISLNGEAGFYEGAIAKRLVSGIRSSGGILTEADLKDYKAQLRAPLIGHFHGFEIITMPPPSSGGIALLQMLSFMELAQKNETLLHGPGSAPTLSSEAYAMSLAFADRAEHLGDPAFYPVPLSKLLDPKYLSDRWKAFDEKHAHVAPGAGKVMSEPTHTTHLSVIDKDGNAVAMTITINDNFGSGFVPPGTGVVMNNQMDDFSAQAGAPNLFGLVGAEANSIQPGKRPLSSMTPTIVRDSSGANRIALGAAGGPRIITAVFQTLLNRFQWGMSLTDSVASPRIHHQWKPETVWMEKYQFSDEIRETLRKSGYQIEDSTKFGVVHAVERLANQRVVGAPDPRGEGAAVSE